MIDWSISAQPRYVAVVTGDCPAERKIDHGQPESGDGLKFLAGKP
jgi:hypothetical protein